MLLRTALFAAFVVVLATQIPSLIGRLDQAPSPEAPEPAAAQQARSNSQPASAASGTTVLSADGRGHFTGTFRINGKPVPGLVDTGASLVAINESTARRLGFGANSLDFRHRVNTANGQTQAAHIVLDRIEIGSVRAYGVDAFVLRDDALGDTLVGMSFLQKLKSYQVQGENLTLNN
jgi:aspartyl protease family protein